MTNVSPLQREETTVDCRGRGGGREGGGRKGGVWQCRKTSQFERKCVRVFCGGWGEGGGERGGEREEGDLK